MGYSQLKIPKICEYCGNPLEAKTVVTRFCSSSCTNKSGKEKKRQSICLNRFGEVRLGNGELKEYPNSGASKTG